MNKKYKTLLDLAKKVCEGVMNYYDSKDEGLTSNLVTLL